MELPEGLSEHDYCERLRQYRDEALERSRLWGNTGSQPGKLHEIARADWYAEDDSIAVLVHERLKIFGAPILRSSKTNLVLVEVDSDSDARIEKHYEMDLDRSGRIDQYTRVVIEDNFLEYVSHQTARKKARALGLSSPTYEELHRVFSEMKRGASGMYPVHRPGQRD